MEQHLIFLTLLGMLGVTYLPRVFPVLLLSSRSLPPLVTSWLKYVPVAVLAAMLLPSLVIQEGHVSFGLKNLFFWAAFPTIFVAWKTRSFFGAVIVAMGLVAAARYLFSL
jgi:branched-subunit amino acid transport protein